MVGYTYSDNVFSFEGSVSVQCSNHWCKPWRLDYKKVEFFPHVDEVAEMPSGVRIAFTTDTENIALKLHELQAPSSIDLTIDGIYRETIKTHDTNVEFSKLEPGMKNIEIWLEPAFGCSIEKVMVDDNAKIQRTAQTAKRWVHYGSSISHSHSTESPSKIWTALVANNQKWHLTNLGVAGQCMLEPMMARTIRDLPADLISLKLGINCHGGALSKRTFKSSVIGLIQIIREKHVDTPIAVISPIFSPEREEHEHLSISLSLIEMRNVIKEVVETTKKYGDEKIVYIDGLKLVGEQEAYCMEDKLHPGVEGQHIMADNYIKYVVPELEKLFLKNS